MKTKIKTIIIRIGIVSIFVILFFLSIFLFPVIENKCANSEKLITELKSELNEFNVDSLYLNEYTDFSWFTFYPIEVRSVYPLLKDQTDFEIISHLYLTQRPFREEYTTRIDLGTILLLVFQDSIVNLKINNPIDTKVDSMHLATFYSGMINEDIITRQIVRSRNIAMNLLKNISDCHFVGVSYDYIPIEWDEKTKKPKLDMGKSKYSIIFYHKRWPYELLLVPNEYHEQLFKSSNYYWICDDWYIRTKYWKDSFFPMNTIKSLH